MKTHITKYKLPVALFTLFSFYSFNGFAQQQETYQQKATVTKGYYAIGNSPEKVKSRSLKVIQGNPPNVTKGYYAIGNHNKKLPKPITVVVTSVPKPNPTKGYYFMNTDSLHNKSPQ